MSGLVPADWRALERFLISVGCTFERQKGSHRVYWREGLVRPIILPAYKAVPVFVIRGILRQLGISVEDYLRGRR
jgi:predicted RNA binding protein YcfA (HicA-like mRNA interferase family)